MHQNDWGQSNNSHHARLRGVTSKRRSRYNQVAWRRGTSIDAVHAGTAERIRSCRRGAIRLPVRLQGAIRQARMVAGRHSAASSVAGRRPASQDGCRAPFGCQLGCRAPSGKPGWLQGAIRLPVRLQGAVRQAGMVAGRHSAASSVGGAVRQARMVAGRHSAASSVGGAIRQARMVAGRHSAASSVAGRRPAAESAMCSAELSATGTRARECGFSACMLAARSPKVATLSVVQRHKTLQISSTWRRFAACLQPLYTSLPAASCVQQLEPSAKALIGCH